MRLGRKFSIRLLTVMGVLLWRSCQQYCTYSTDFDAAEATGRRVVLTGHDVENIVRTAIQLKNFVWSANACW